MPALVANVVVLLEPFASANSVFFALRNYSTMLFFKYASSLVLFSSSRWNRVVVIDSLL